MNSRKSIVLSLLAHVIAVGSVAYAIILLAVYAIPHLPLANARTFHIMLRAQMTLDRELEVAGEGEKNHHLLFLGSSVVEGGVDDLYMDSVFKQQGLRYYATNSGAGGFFSKANLIMFRAMLEQG
ncbi:MAG: hypothetical protein ABI778_06090 [Ignavibacteriota bacterium]